MTKQGTRIISIFIILLLIIGFIPETCLPRLFTVKAHAEEIPAAFSLEESPLGNEMQDGQWHYALRTDDGYAVITGYDGDETAVSVPESVGGYDVVGVASKALAGKMQVSLPGTVYYLAEDAFGDSTPEIIAPNGSYALWWAVAHDCTYRTGKDYKLVPGVIDYTDAPSWRVSKRGEDYVAIDPLYAMPLKTGSLFLMRDRRGMEFFYRVTELTAEDGIMIAAVEIPEISEVFINYKTTVDVALTADDFVPADGVSIEKAPPRLRSVSSGTDTQTTPLTVKISGKTFGKMSWSGSAGANLTETVSYTLTIVNGEITKTELTKTESKELFIKIECSASDKIFEEINDARERKEKLARGEQVENDNDFDLRIGYQIDHGSVAGSLADLEKWSKAVDEYEKTVKSNSRISHSSKLGEYRLQLPWGNLSIRADFEFSVSGSFTHTFTDNTVTVQHYDSDTDEWVVDDSYCSVFSNDNEETTEIEIEGNVCFKIELSIGAVFMSNLSAQFEVGIDVACKKVFANNRSFNNCVEISVEPYAELKVYAGAWVGKNLGAKIQIYSNKWSAQDLTGKEYLWKSHFNSALADQWHLAEDCPLKDTNTVHYMTRCGLTIKDRDIFPGGALTSAYNPNLNEDPHVSSAEWLAGAFLGWAWSPSDTTPTAAAVGEDFQNSEEQSTPYHPTADCSVYDVWENMSTVSFDSNGGSTVEAQVVPIGGHVLRPDDPIKGDKHILAWKTQDGTVWNFAQDTVSADMTLIADWGDGEPEPGGTEGYWYIGNIEEVSDDCLYDPYQEGWSTARYFEYEERTVADGHKVVVITGIKNNPVHLVVPARLPSLTDEHATLEVFDIVNGAFANCESLRSAYFLTDNQKQITADSLFSGCTNLEYVEAPALENGRVGSHMFDGCSSLKCVKMRGSSKEIDSYAFAGTAISSCIIETGITTIDCYAFSNCVAMEELYIPDSVKELGVQHDINYYGYGPFDGCTGLKTISVGGVEVLEPYDLCTGSTALETLIIRGTVKTIDDYAFQSGSVEHVTSNTRQNGFGSSYGHPVALILEEGVESIGICAFGACGAFTSVSIPSSIKTIGRGAFSSCTGLTSLEISCSASLDQSAFRDCTNLKQVKLNNVNTVDGFAFSNCTNLRELELNGVSFLGQCAFNNCTALEHLYIPDSVKSMDRPFEGCTGIKTISIGGIETLQSFMLYTGSEVLEKITIRGSVINIGEGALDDRTIGSVGKPFDIVIEDGVKSIGVGAFSNCSRMRSVTIPESVTSIGGNAFECCTGLKEISIHSKLEYLEDFTFNNCRSLEKVTLYQVKRIGSATSYGGDTFFGCTSLREINLGAVEHIGNHAFCYCTSLKEIDLTSVKSIGEWAFSDCTSLEKLYIPETLTIIGDCAFRRCTSLNDILIQGQNMPFEEDSLIHCDSLKVHMTSENEDLVQYCYSHNIPFDTVTAFPHTLTLHMSRYGENDKTEREVTWLSELNLPTLEWDGHTFDGWYMDEALTERCTFETMPPRDLTLYAGWKELSQNAQYRTESDHVTLLRYMELEDEDVVYLPEAVEGLPLTVIASGAFADSNVTELHIPSTVTDIETGAFAGSSLRSFHVSPDNNVYRSANSAIYSKDGTELLFFPPMGRYSMTVPAGVTSIGPYAFACSQLDSITFNEGLSEISEHAFENTQLTEIELPESVETIGECAFSGCEDLHYIEAAGNPTAIGDNAFVGCSPFLTVYGPNEDCTLRTAIRGGGYRYNAYTLTLEAPLRTIKRVYDAGTELLLPTSSETAENERFTGWFADSGRTDPFTGTVMPAQDLTLYAGTETIYEYESITDPDSDEIIGLRITGCHAPGAEIVVPDTISGIPVNAIDSGAFGQTYTRVTLPSAINEIAGGAFAANTVLVCAPDSAAEAAALAAGYNVGARSWTLRWESGFALTPDSAQLNAGEVIVAPNIERSGYELAGWYYDENLTEALTTGDVMPAHNVTLYADWNVMDEEVAQIADNLRWTLNGETITVTGYTGTGTDLSIPASLHGKTVTAIAPNAFAYNNSVTEIVLPNTVATLGEKAFFAMHSLQSLTLPAGLKALPADALNGCSALETLSLPEGLENVAANALANTGLTELCLPASLLTLDASALRGCTSLSEILVASGNTWFESRDGVLYDTSDGILVKYPAAKVGESYTVSDAWSIGAWAFENAQALQDVTFNTEIYSLGTGAFRNCSGLAALPVLGEYVSKIPDECFYGCASLSAETLPESVRELGRYAFANSGLRELTVSDQLTRIGAFALGSDVLLRGESGCYAQTWAEENGLAFVPTGSALVESISLPETRVTLNRGERLLLSPSITPAEAGDTVLQYLSANEKVVRVDENGRIYAVGGGSTTVYVSAPGGASTSCVVTVEAPKEVSGTWGELTWTLTTDGRLIISGEGDMADFAINSPEAWKEVSDLVCSVFIEPGVTSIGQYAFFGCDNMTRAAIPATVTSIGNYAFSSCSGLTSVTIPAGVTSIGNGVFSSCCGLTSVTIPADVTSFGNHAFYGCSGLTSVTIPAGVTSIGDWAFYGCSGLTSMTIPAGVTSIADYAFYNCSGLTSMTIPTGVTNVGNSAFYGCSGLTSVTIPASVTSIGNSAFVRCSGLTSVTIPAGVTSIADYAFYNCNSLTSVTIPVGVTSISNGAFSGCIGLMSVSIPAGVTSIGNTAFYGCDSMTRVIIPESVTSIGNSAFLGAAITNIYYEGSEAQWQAISIAEYNDPLFNATIQYNFTPDFVLPAALTEIGEEAFTGGAFTYVKLPENVVSIAWRAFADCPKLAYIYIPSLTTQIDPQAFGNLQGVTIIGQAGTTAESYAHNHNYTFIAIG